MYLIYVSAIFFSDAYMVSNLEELFKNCKIQENVELIDMIYSFYRLLPSTVVERTHKMYYPRTQNEIYTILGCYPIFCYIMYYDQSYSVIYYLVVCLFKYELILNQISAYFVFI
jgi:hypothetical protein